MKKLSDYINNLKFEYAISYSGLRGEEFERLQILNKNEISKIEKEISTARYMEKPKLENKINNLRDEINNHKVRIINEKEELHKSTKQIHRFEKGDEALNQLFDILNTKKDDKMAMMCLPTFRDSIVFYSKEYRITGILHLCFGCKSIINEKEESFDFSYKLYPKLKSAFIKLGHEIEGK